MKLVSDKINIDTKAPTQFIEITQDVRNAAKKAGFDTGFMIISSQHTTAALCINERCERLQKDMVEFLHKLVPPSGDYKHNVSTVDNRNNAHSHLASLFLKTSEVVQFANGEPMIGTWQSIFFIELDGPRTGRSADIMMVGDFKENK